MKSDSKAHASLSISLAECARMLRDEILITADIRAPKNTNRKPILGRTCQVSRDTAPEVLSKILDDLGARGITVSFGRDDPDIYDRRQGSRWAKEIFSGLTSGSREAVDEDPFALARKVLGRLVYIGKEKGSKGRKISHYILTDAATPMELRVAADKAFNKGNREANLGHKARSNLLQVVDFMHPNETLRDAEARRLHNIGNGRKPK